MFFFFCGSRGLNPKPYIYYTLSKPTEKHRIIKEGDCKFIIENLLMKYGILRKFFEVD